MENKANDVTKMTALLAATLAAFLVPFMGSSLNVALPTIGNEFAADAVLLSWISASFLLASAIFTLPFGRIADIYGLKRIFTYGIITYTIFSFLAGIAPSALLLVLFRAFQGIGASMIFGTGMAILTSVFPLAERGKALGINLAGVYFGLSIGPFLGGIMTQYLGWRSIFFLNVLLGLIVISFVLLRLKGEWAECMGEKFDIKSAVVYSFALLFLMYGFSSLPGTLGIILTVMGIVGVLVFIIVDMRVDNPLLDMNLFFKNRIFALSNLAALINYSTTTGAVFLLSLYLQYILGYSPQRAGLVLLPLPLIMVIISPIAGELSDKIDPRILASIGMALTAVGLSFFIYVGFFTGLPYIIAGQLVLGSGFALFSSPNTNAIMGSVKKRNYGVASATASTMRLSGQVLSFGIIILIFSLLIGKVQITPDTYFNLLGSIRVAFKVFAVACFIGIFTTAYGKIASI
ncbi:MFS transporter [Methanobacterium sp.]|uniref:MFS transporter n=1 Tax=Methanobacterium sp. TaxID=2164 RepID=UPI00315964A5